MSRGVPFGGGLFGGIPFPAATRVIGGGLGIVGVALITATGRGIGWRLAIGLLAVFRLIPRAFLSLILVGRRVGAA